MEHVGVVASSLLLALSLTLLNAPSAVRAGDGGRGPGGGNCRGETALNMETAVVEGGNLGPLFRWCHWTVVPDLLDRTGGTVGFRVHNLILLASDWDELTMLRLARLASCVTGTRLEPSWGNVFYDQYTPTTDQSSGQPKFVVDDKVAVPASVMWWSQKAGDYSKWSYYIHSEDCALTVVDTTPGSGSISLAPTDSHPKCIAWRIEAATRDAVTLTFTAASLRGAAVLKVFSGTSRNGRVLGRWDAGEGSTPPLSVPLVGESSVFVWAFVQDAGSSFAADWVGADCVAPVAVAMAGAAAGVSLGKADFQGGRCAPCCRWRATGGGGAAIVAQVGPRLLPSAAQPPDAPPLASAPLQVSSVVFTPAGYLRLSDPARPAGSQALGGAASRAARLPNPNLGFAARRLPTVATDSDDILLEFFPSPAAFDAPASVALHLWPAPAAAPACSGTATLTDTDGYILTAATGRAYAAGTACEWIIDPAAPYDLILLTFHAFEMPHGLDALSVWAGTATDGSGPVLLDAHTGMDVPYSLSTPGGAASPRGMALKFASDAARTDTYPYQGFLARYRAATCTVVTLTAAAGRQTLTASTRCDPCCLWKVAPDPAAPFALSVLSFSSDELDSVRIYAGAERSVDALAATLRGALELYEAAASTLLSRAGEPFLLEILQGPARPAVTLSVSWAPADCIAGAEEPAGPGSAFRGARGIGDPFALPALPGHGPAASSAFPLLRCTWLLAPGGGRPAAVALDRLEAERGRDFLALYDGSPPTVAGGVLMGALAGPVPASAPRSWTSTSSSVYLSYVSTRAAAVSGPVPAFAVAYETAGAAALCDGAVTLTADAGTITDGAAGGAYVNGMSCSWLVQPVAASGSVVLLFSRFSTQPGDVVTVYDGADDSADVLGEFSGEPAAPFEVRGTGVALYVTFASDGTGVAGGFEASYARETGFCAPGGVALHQASAPSITAAFGPAAASADCSWVVDRRAAGFDSVWLTLPALASLAPGDALVVRDGPGADAPVLLQADSAYAGGEVRGSAAALRVAFTSAASNANPLAGASYASVKCPAGGCSGHGKCVRGSCQCDPGFQGENCAVTEPGWTCGVDKWRDGVCDCNCGAIDPDCVGLASFPASVQSTLRGGDCAGAGAAYPDGTCAHCPVPAALSESDGFRVLYVSPVGSDVAGDGAWLSPFATLLRAARDVETGTTIALMPGRYTGIGFCGGLDYEVFGNTSTPSDISIVGLGGRDFVLVDCSGTGGPTAFVNSWMRNIRIRGITWMRGAATPDWVSGCVIFHPRSWDLAAPDARLTVAIEESRFLGCSGPGGALRIRLARRVFIRNVDFVGNRRVGSPEDCPFQNFLMGPENANLYCNTYTPGAVIAGGGAVQIVYSTEVRIEGCTFTDNFSELPSASPVQAGSYYTLGGGAVHVEIAELVAVDGCRFAGNGNGLGASTGALLAASPGGGGAISVKRAQLLVVRGSSFLNNSSPLGHGGGAWLVDGTSGLLSDLTFDGNSARLGGGISFGGFASRDYNGIATVRSASVYLYNSSFTRHRAANADGTGAGGVLYADSTAALALDVRDVTISGAVADRGGALYLAAPAVAVAQRLSMTDTRALQSGGALYLAGGVLTLLDSTSNRSSTSAPNARGGFARVTDCAPAGATEATVASPLVNGTAHVLFRGVRVSESAATGEGGALAVDGRCAVRLESSAVLHARSDGSGGGAFVSSARLALARAEFDGCRTLSDGGAVAVEGDADLAAADARFANNAASGFSSMGGAVAIAATDASHRHTMERCSFLSNAATIAGGALFVSGSSTAAVSASSFTSNSAPSGGAIAATHRGSLSLAGVAASENAAARGGALFTDDLSVVSADGVTLSANAASEQGGGAALAGSSSLLLRASSVRGNRASSGRGTGSGAGLHVSGAACATVATSSFASNSAAERGGGALVQTTCESVSFEGGSISGNAAGAMAGGLCVEAGGVRAAGVAVSDNTAPEGAGVHLRGGSLRLFGGSVSANRAAKSGGGLYYSAPSTGSTAWARLEVNGTALDGNAALSGGAAYVALPPGCESLALAPSSVAGNVASAGGGGAFFVSDAAPLRCPALSAPSCAARYWNNTATYGSACATEEKSMRARLLTAQAASGDPIAITVELLDAYGDRVLSDTASPIKAFDPAGIVDLDATLGLASPALSAAAANASSVLLKGSVVASTAAGLASFDAIAVTSKPGSSPTITFVLQAAGRPALRVALDIPLRRCVRGEIQLVTSVCSVCPTGTYSLVETGDATQCLPCVSGGFCFGGDLVRPAEGHWQSDRNETFMVKCINGQCLAPSTTVVNAAALARNYTRCTEGYTGPVCTVCAPGYGRTGDYNCVKCPDPATNRGLGALIAFIIAVVAGLMVWSTLRSAGRIKLSETSVVIKILLDYLQIVTLAKNFEVEWTFSAQFLFDVQRAASSPIDSVFSVDCIMSFDNSAMHPFYARLVAMMVLPVFVSLVPGAIFIPWAVWRSFMARRTKPAPAGAASAAPALGAGSKPAPAAASGRGPWPASGGRCRSRCR
eukprot:tig00021312_g20050.t1